MEYVRQGSRYDKFFRLKRSDVMLMVIVLIAGFLVGAVSAAYAGVTSNCTGGVMAGAGTWSTGSTNRWTGGNSAGNIIWSYSQPAACPDTIRPGGNTAHSRMRTVWCSGGSSTGRSYSNPNGWNGAVATQVLPGTCFKMGWFAYSPSGPTPGVAANKAFHGQVVWKTS